MAQHSEQFLFEGFDNPNTTPVPDIVFDRLLAKLGEAELKALLYIIRRTFGFKRNHDSISFNQFLRGIVKLDGTVLDDGAGIRSRSTLSAALKSLEAKGIVTSAKGIDERGENETTVYSLRFKHPAGDLDGPRTGVVRIPHHRSTDAAPPVVRNSYPQETGLQETDRQQTAVVEYANGFPEVNAPISKFRKGSAADFPGRETGKQHQHQPAAPPTGFASVASVLSTNPAASPPAPAAGKRATGAADGAQPTGPARSLAAAAETMLSHAERPENRPNPSPVVISSAALVGPASEARELVAAYIPDFAAEFHDQASRKASITRALHLLSASGYPQERWSEKLYEARRLTRERSAAIGYRGKGNARSASTGPVNKMPYYFETLACVLGLHDHPAGQHPLPLSPDEFKRRQSSGGTSGKRPAKVPPVPAPMSADQEHAPERKSLAGSYAHLVHR